MAEEYYTTNRLFETPHTATVLILPNTIRHAYTKGPTEQIKKKQPQRALLDMFKFWNAIWYSMYGYSKVLESTGRLTDKTVSNNSDNTAWSIKSSFPGKPTLTQICFLMFNIIQRNWRKLFHNTSSLHRTPISQHPMYEVLKSKKIKMTESKVSVFESLKFYFYQYVDWNKSRRKKK